ncbi:MAG: PAS domain-containing sensor histidine kinase [Caloramator sp.]|nr:PAS domain-containing sensor histidine kinase [Caloramator sp.]
MEFVSIFKGEKNIEEALNESELKFKSLTEATSSYILICSENKILYANPAAEKFIGYSLIELQKMNVKDLVHPDFKHFFLECTLTQKKAVLSPEVYEIKVITKYKETKWVNATATAIKINNEYGILITAFDITDKKIAEEKLLENEKKYKNLIKLLPDGIFIFDEEKCLYVNEAGIKMLAAENYEHIVGKNYTEIIHSDYQNLFKEIINYSIKNILIPSPLTEIKIKCCNGNFIDVEIRCVSFTLNGKTEVLSIFRDITLRKTAIEIEKLLKQALEHDKLVTEFFSNMSHELRTPINVIISALQMCDLMYKNGTIFTNTEKLKKYFSIMRQNCYRLIKLTNNIIDITKMESGYVNMNFKNYNIVELIEDITFSVSDYIENKGINLIFDTNIEEKIIACDADKIERIMLNLLSNAIKFTDIGGTITVKIEDNKDNILISVEDTGIGISEDKQKIIFERFVQADMSLSRPSEGSGIGLSLVKSLVELHGGKIYLNSTLGKGSKFTFELPCIILTENDTNLKVNKYMPNNKVERINIEFSDIYS